MHFQIKPMTLTQLLDETEVAVWAHHVFGGNTVEASVAYAEELLAGLVPRLPKGFDVAASARALVAHVASPEWGKGARC